MKPGSLDLPVIWRGCEYAPITFQSRDQTGNPFELTGWSPLAMTRNGTNLNAVITDVENGVTQITMSPAQTGNLKLGTVNWDWVWFFNDVPQPPILTGSIPVKEPLTNISAPLPPSPPPPPAPANDAFANASVLPGVTDHVNPIFGTTVGATVQTGEPPYPGEDASVWYRFTAPMTLEYVFRLNSAAQEMRIYTGTAINMLTLIGRSSNNGALTLVLTASQSVYMRVTPSSGFETGQFSFNWTSLPG